MRKNRIKPRLNGIGLLPLPFFLLFGFSFVTSPLYVLSYSPLNAETTAFVDQDSLIFQEIGQSLTVHELQSAALINIKIHVSGFLLVESTALPSLPVFTLTMENQTKTIQDLQQMGWIESSFFLPRSREFTLRLTNFATLEATSLTYQVIVDQVIIMKRGL